MINKFLISKVKSFQNDWEKFGLSGQVKSLKIEENNLLQKPGQSSNGQIYLMQFNESGNLSEEMTYYQGRSLPETQITYHYDERKLVREKMEKLRDGPLMTEKYIYNDHGNLTQISYAVQENDANGIDEHPIEKSVSDFIGNAGVEEIDRELLKYGTQNRVMQIDAYCGNQLCFKTVFQYDDATNEMTETHYRLGRRNLLFRNEQARYNDHGHKVYHEVGNAKSEVVFSTHYIYNTRGDLIEQYSKDFREQRAVKKVFEYRYDERQNWYLRWLKIDGVGAMENRREVVYYQGM